MQSLRALTYSIPNVNRLYNLKLRTPISTTQKLQYSTSSATSNDPITEYHEKVKIDLEKVVKNDEYHIKELNDLGDKFFLTGIVGMGICDILAFMLNDPTVFLPLGIISLGGGIICNLATTHETNKRELICKHNKNLIDINDYMYEYSKLIVKSKN